MQAEARDELRAIEVQIRKLLRKHRLKPKDIPARISRQTKKVFELLYKLEQQRQRVERSLGELEGFMVHLSIFTQKCSSVHTKFRPLFMSLARLCQYVYRAWGYGGDREVVRWPQSARGYLEAFAQGTGERYRESFNVPRDSPFACTMAALASHMYALTPRSSA